MRRAPQLGQKPREERAEEAGYRKPGFRSRHRRQVGTNPAMTLNGNRRSARGRQGDPSGLDFRPGC